MPSRRKQTFRRNKRSRRNTVGRTLSDQNRTTRATLRVLSNAAISQTSGVVTVSEISLTIANLGSRGVDLGDCFMYWRLVGLRCNADLQSGALSSTIISYPGAYTYGVGFIPISNADYTAPTSVIQICDFPEFVQISGDRKARITVGRNGCIGSMMTKWLTVNTQGAAADLQSAGTVTLFSIAGPISDATTQGNVRLITELDVEFKTPIDSALIPLFGRRRLSSQPYGCMKPNRVTEISKTGEVTTLLDEVKYNIHDFKGEREEKSSDRNDYISIPPPSLSRESSQSINPFREEKVVKALPSKLRR